MTNQFYPSEQPIGIDLVQANIALRMVDKLIVVQTPEFQVFSKFETLTGVGKKNAVKRIFEQPYQPDITLTATIAARTLANGVLTLTWDDQSIDYCNENTVIQSLSVCDAISIENGQGYAKFVFAGSGVSGQTSITASDFLLGEKVYFRGVQPNVNASNVGTDRIVIMPLLRTNMVGAYVGTFSYSGEEARTPSYLEMTDPEGTKFFIETNEMDTLRKVKLDKQRNMYDSNMFTNGKQYKPDGFSNQISKNGGVMQPFQGTLSEPILQNAILQAAKSGAFPDGEITFLCNTAFKMMFQNSTIKNYVVYPGDANTFGVKNGINGSIYEACGMRMKFIIDPILNNPNAFNEKPIAYGFSTMPVMTNKGVKPWADNYYLGYDDIQVSRFGGLYDSLGNFVPNAKVRSNVSTVDGRLDMVTILNNPQQGIKFFQV